MSNYPILYGESGAHNLFIVDQRTKKELDAFLTPQKQGIGWAIGGQFRGPGHERGQKPWYDGIWLYHLLRPDVSEVKCERVTRLVTGEHDEGSASDDYNPAEFNYIYRHNHACHYS